MSHRLESVIRTGEPGKYDRAFVDELLASISATLRLQDTFTDNFFRVVFGRYPTSGHDMICCDNSTLGVTWAFIRLTSIQMIKHSSSGPRPDEKKGEYHFLQYSSEIQEMAWMMVERYANPISVQLPDWPLLCFCAEAFDAIARHYNIQPEQFRQLCAGDSKALPQPDG